MTINNTLRQEPSPLNEAFPATLLAIATLQILANSTQFTAVRPIPLSTLTDVAAGYLQLLAQAARAHADHSGRTSINAWDISGLLENLDGPGALSGLHNWCIDNLGNHQKQTNISPPTDPVDTLSHLAENLKEFSHTPSVQPITTLSFLPLTDAEIAALDRAGESDLEDDHPSPSTSSSSSEEDSDIENLAHKQNQKYISSPQPKILLSPLEDQDLINSTTSWRSIDDIPPYVPAHFPPFPGLERATATPPVPNLINEEESNQQNQPSRAHSPPIDHQHITTNQQNPYLFAVPFSRSQLSESHGPSFIAPKSFKRSTSPTATAEDGRSEESPPRKKAKLSSGSLEGFLQTYAYMVEEKMTNSKMGTEELKFMKRNSVRHRFIAEDQTEPFHSSIIGSIPVGSIRTNRWSAGWIPHPPSRDGRRLPQPELKPFGHTPLPLPVTTPVPIQFPACPPFHQPHPRIPDLIPRLFERVRQDAKGDKFTLVSRMSRLGPPSELGEAGEPLPYRIKDLAPPAANASSSASLAQPKYLEWGFHWPPHDGRDPLPPPRPPSDFKPPEFPGMPKTTAEKLRLVQREKELAALAAASNPPNPPPSLTSDL